MADLTRITSAELAAKLGLSAVTVERWRRAGKGPPFYRMMGRVMYDSRDVQAWIEQLKDPGKRTAPRQSLTQRPPARRFGGQAGGQP